MADPHPRPRAGSPSESCGRVGTVRLAVTKELWAQLGGGTEELGCCFHVTLSIFSDLGGRALQMAQSNGAGEPTT